jgi:hypothetical protein
MIWSDSQRISLILSRVGIMFLYNIHADNHCSMYNVLFVQTVHIIFVHNDDSTHNFFCIKVKCAVYGTLLKNGEA